MKQKPTVSWYVKINFLVLGFLLCIYGIYAVNHRGLPPGLLSMFGLKPQVTSQRDSFCKTRVLGLIQPQKVKIMQEGNQWVAENSSTEYVNFISVEKWLSRFCSIHPDAGTPDSVEASAGNGFVPALFVKFIDGAVDILRSDSAGRFEWHGQVFKSDDLSNALRELSQLPSANSEDVARPAKIKNN